ncbi:MAG: hypothetical protein M0T74_18090 [Desulfitobacterium hafniense]|nr:hypothetical protein [Desulfitobacterium hafniense]
MQRPIGVAIFSVLNLIGGFGLLGLQLILGSSFGEISESMGISNRVLEMSVLFLAVIGILSGIGMWLGTKWGWWLGAFYYSYGIFRDGSTLISILSIGEDLVIEGDRGIEYHIVKYAIGALLYTLVFLYFFKGNVLNHFDLSGLAKARAIGIIATINAVLGTLFYFVV